MSALRSSTPKQLQQSFYRPKAFPHIELRLTQKSSQPYHTHAHSTLSVGLVTAGCTQLNTQGTKIDLQAGDIILLAPEQAHACCPVEGASRSYAMFYLDAEWCLEQLSALYGRKVCHLSCLAQPIQDPALFSALLSMASRLAAGEARALSDLSLQSVLFAYCVADDICPPQRLNKIKADLLNDVSGLISLEQLAKQHACSKETLIRQFNHAFGLSPMAMRSNARIEAAKLLLRQGRSIVDTALDLGFSDQSQLHKAFVKFTASTPGQYQASISDNNSS